MFKFFYKKILKPILFCFPADIIHVVFLGLGNFLGKYNVFKKLVEKLFFYKNQKLNQQVLKINFENPVGLAAGFDYDADLVNILPSVGFGFETIGTVTNLPYGGNPKPRLGRLPKSKSLIVNKGFKNVGVEKILEKLRNKERKIPFGISVGATNKEFENLETMAEDIVFSFEKILKENYFDYFELNISCPNLINSQNLKEKFDDTIGLELLLKKLSILNISRPLFIKMPLEKGVASTILLVEVASKYNFVSGLIFSNLAKDRNNSSFHSKEIGKAGIGNFSGKPTEKISNMLISEIYKKYKNRFILIGCGGVFSAEDAYEKIKRGATLVQIITGMIYEGPSVIGEINKDLVKLLKKDGYQNISEAIGAYHK